MCRVARNCQRVYSAALSNESALQRSLVVSLLLASACAPDPGRVELTFTWRSDQPKPAEQFWYHVAIEERPDSASSGRTIATGTARLDSPAIEIGDVRNGDDRVVVVEVRDGPTRSGTRVTHRGLSSPFSLSAGVVVQAAVELELSAVPTFTASAAISVLSANAYGFVRRPDVRLRVRGDGPSTIVIANGIGFELGRTEHTLGRATQVDVDHDIDAQLCERPPCPDGPRVIYAKLIDAYGYESAVTSTTVNLDTRPPAIAGGRGEVRPASARADGFVSVALTATERLAAAELGPVDGVAFVRTFPPDKRPSTNFAFVSAQTATALQTGDHMIVATLTDLAGNVATELGVGGFAVDKTPPQVLVFGVAPERVTDTVGSVITAIIAFSEPPDKLEVSMGGRPMPCTDITQPTITCRYSVAGDETGRAETPIAVLIEASDAAGNTVRAERTVVFDFRPPGRLGFSLTPELAGAGTTAIINVLVDEPLRQPPTLDWTTDDPGFVYSATASTQLSHVFILRVANTDDERSYDLEGFELVDLTGNTSYFAEPHRFIRDSRAPSIGNLTVIAAGAPSTQPATIRLGARLDVAFDVTDGFLPSVSAVVLNTGLMCSMTRVSASTHRCECTLVAAPQHARFGEEVGTTLRIRAEDPSGNIDETTAPVVFDYAPPEIVAASIEVTLEPPANSRLSAVTRATVGATVGLRFTASELLAARPFVRTGLPERLEFTQTASAATFFAFGHVVEPLTPERLFDLQVALQDRAGNVSTTTLAAAFVVDTSPPAAAAVDSPDAVRFMRAPWGTAAAPGRAAFEITGQTGAAESGALIIVSSGPGAEIGRGRASTTGGFGPLVLATQDTSDVLVTVVDDASNESAAVRVRDGRWLANLAGYRPADPTSNPHAAVVAPEAAASIVSVETSPTSSGAASLWSPDGDVLTVTTKPIWRQIVASATPPPRWFSTGSTAMAFDSARGRVVLYSDPEQGTWEWDGRSWHLVAPRGTGPSVLFGAQIVYDPRREVVVAFGGAGGTDPFVFEWDGTRWTLGAAVPAALREQPERIAAVWDPIGARVLAFKFVDPVAEVYEFDGSAFRQLPTPATGPGARDDAQVAFHRESGRFIAFGGLVGYDYNNGSPTGTDLDETWAFDGTAWTRLSPAQAPSPRSAVAFVQAPQGGLLLHGGRDIATDLPRSDVWHFDGGQWSPAVAGPPPRYWPAFAYDSVHDEVVVFGGGDFEFSRLIGGELGDTWVYDGARWVERTPNPEKPARRSSQRIARNEDTGELVMHGGSAVGPGTLLGDTWTWNTNRWVATATTGPPAMSFHVMAWDPANRRVMLVERTARRTWELDGAQWNLVDDSTTGPRSIFSGSATDLARGEVVLFGGSGLHNRTDIWNGAAWTQPVPAQSPPPRQNHAMVYDPVRDRTVIFGGGACHTSWLSDTWEWDGATWTEVVTSTSPGQRCFHRAAFDPVIGEMVVFGGRRTAALLFNDVWTFDGTRWRKQETAGEAPPPTTWHELAYDPHNSGILVHRYANEFVMQSVVGQQASLRIDFDWADANVDLTNILSIAANARLGGRGFTSAGAASNGATLEIWDAWNGRWSPIASNDSVAPVEVSGFAVPPERFVRNGRVISLRAHTSGGIAQRSGAAELTADFASISVDYRLDQ